MTRAAERAQLVRETMARVRALEAEKGVTREGVEAMRDELLALARHAHLFSLEDFPPPPSGAEDNNRLYLISEEADRRFALYVQSSRPGVDVPPHNHTTWAVIVGLQGIEENRFYLRGQSGADRTGGQDVGPGTGVAFRLGFMVTSIRFKPVHHNAYIPIYNELNERKMPLAFHAGLTWADDWMKQLDLFISMHSISFVLCNMVHLTNWVIHGMPERFPNMPVIWIESGIAWLAFMMQRLDSEYMMRSSEAIRSRSTVS